MLLQEQYHGFLGFSRHGSSETAKVSSPSASRSDMPNSKPARPLERKPSSRGTQSPERRVVRASELQQQLDQVQEELKRVREEKARALEEVNQMKKAFARREEDVEGPERIKILEGEVERAKESEMKMLESLASQTKQLEGAKIELEEAKLEIRNLHESIRGLEGSQSWGSRNLGRFLEKPKPLDLAQSNEDVVRLRSELKSAIEAEEKNKKAMDDLAFALKEVTTEMNQLKEKLSMAESDLDRVRPEAEQSKLLLMATEEKLQAALEEAERLHLEADESGVAWNAKENVFLNCMKESEEEIAKLKQENCRLAESQGIGREESSKLRDIMKQALNEATIVKEALEIARRENSQLKDLLSDRENSLKTIQQDYESLKVSEAAALQSVKELQDLLAAASSATEMRSTYSIDAGSITKTEAVVKEGSARRGIAKSPSERWRCDDLHIENGLTDPGADSGAFLGSMSERVASSGKKDNMCAPPPLHDLDNGEVYPDDFDHIERLHFDNMYNERGIPARQKKKNPILRKFGELLKRGSLQK